MRTLPPSSSPSLAFPGQLAGASLKRWTRGTRTGGAGAFPGQLAGASLKRLELQIGDRLALDFPRPTRRGLIEATLPASPPARRARPFPGQLAGASLKRPQSWRVRPPRAGAFPGQLAGASLKLDTCESSWKMTPSFPGQLAGASLKRRTDTYCRPYFRSFPGQLAGASLKRAPLHGARAPPNVLSPANSPGPH